MNMPLFNAFPLRRLYTPETGIKNTTLKIQNTDLYDRTDKTDEIYCKREIMAADKLDADEYQKKIADEHERQRLIKDATDELRTIEACLLHLPQKTDFYM